MWSWFLWIHFTESFQVVLDLCIGTKEKSVQEGETDQRRNWNRYELHDRQGITYSSVETMKLTKLNQSKSGRKQKVHTPSFLKTFIMQSIVPRYCDCVWRRTLLFINSWFDRYNYHFDSNERWKSTLIVSRGWPNKVPATPAAVPQKNSLALNWNPAVSLIVCARRCRSVVVRTH